MFDLGKGHGVGKKRKGEMLTHRNIGLEDTHLQPNGNWECLRDCGSGKFCVLEKKLS